MTKPTIRTTCSLMVICTLLVPRLCSTEPMVQVIGLQPEYQGKTIVRATVRNVSSERLAINVGVEELVDGHWIEALSTITDERYLDRRLPTPMNLKLSIIAAKGSLDVSFEPSQLGGDTGTRTCRLRVDAHNTRGISGRVDSAPFRVVVGRQTKNQ
jgi:hypothetical protein